MSYIYSARNLLDEPHSYMYSDFRGHALLESYLDNRFAVLRRHVPSQRASAFSSGDRDATLLGSVLSALKKGGGAGRDYSQAFRNLLQKELPGFLDVNVESLEAPEADVRLPQPGSVAQGTIRSGDALTAMVHRLARQPVDPEAGELLDAFLHRFEISKKLYSTYDSNLRGGEGGCRDARLYWLLALGLCLHLLGTGRMKYASTLLKCTDLLCSLPAGKLREELPGGGLSLLLTAEISCMQQLAEEKGVYAVE